jgi:hypothetical protein
MDPGILSPVKDGGLVCCGRLMRRALVGVVCVSFLAAARAQDVLDEGPKDGTFSPKGRPCDPRDVRPPGEAWEKAYLQRVDAMINAKTWGLGGLGDADSGKRAWPAILAELYKVRNDPKAMDAIIAGNGRAAMLSGTAGTWHKPFSCPGFSMYYFKMKNRLPADQKNHVPRMITSVGWGQVTRPDQHMDPIYKKTEFNSENFNWMARLCGFLFARELNDPKRIEYFDAYVNNWVRALFNAGRVEWDSTCYFGHTFYPILALYECAPDAESKLKAQAALDWMVITLALHDEDGFVTGPDSRAKSHPYLPFAGSAWDLGYLYFAGPGFPSFTLEEATKHVSQHVAFAAWSSYRPPQVAIDIAQRKFRKPVEMHNAKPFYHIDFDNYADWKGNTERSRRFEFETMYYDEHYSLGSLAAGRPDGKVGTFSEQSVWRLAVKRNTGGGLQAFGNAGAFSEANGRCPFEEIGQYRNVMMRLIKGADRMWVAFPKTIKPEWDGDLLFADLGSDVYVAALPYRSSGHEEADKEERSKSGEVTATHRRYLWTFDATALGGVVMEVGTRRDHASYDRFKSNVKSKTALGSKAEDTLEYQSTLGRNLKVKFMPLKPYKLSDETARVIEQGGVVPKVWCDGKHLDFQTWQVYHVVSGEPICEIPRGSGSLTATVDGKGMQIVVDPKTAKVEYRKIDGR